MKEYQDLCKCGKVKMKSSQRCRECFEMNKRGQLSKSQSEKNRYDQKKGENKK